MMHEDEFNLAEWVELDGQDPIICPHCGGTGGHPYLSATCKHCGGSGEIGPDNAYDTRYGITKYRVASAVL